MGEVGVGVSKRRVTTERKRKRRNSIVPEISSPVMEHTPVGRNSELGQGREDKEMKESRNGGEEEKRREKETFRGLWGGLHPLRSQAVEFKQQECPGIATL